MPITLADLVDAFDWANVSPYGEVEVWIDRLSGQVHARADGVEEELPADIDSNERFLALPDRRDLELGKPLALAFARRFLEADFDAVREMFSHRGAYGRFKTLLARRNVLDAWYAFETEATRDALQAWAQDNDLEVADAPA